MSKKFETAQVWAKNEGLQRIFEAEIRNEDHGGDRPATLSSTINSIMQMPGDILVETIGEVDDVVGTMTALVMVRDLVSGTTPVRFLLKEN